MIEKNIKIKMPAGVPPMVAGPFEVLLPMVVDILFFIFLDQVCIATLGSGLTNLVFTVFSPLISATASLPSMLFIVLLTVVFWFFGIHGDNMVSAITTPIFTGNLVANLAAYNANKEIPNIIAGNLAPVNRVRKGRRDRKRFFCPPRQRSAGRRVFRRKSCRSRRAL